MDQGHSSGSWVADANTVDIDFMTFAFSHSRFKAFMRLKIMSGENAVKTGMMEELVMF